MRRKNVVTIGGGTGSFMLLSGLKKYPLDISAIVSMMDDGGSTGVLRDELGVLPPGDVRQCLVALSQSSDTLRELMNYRFEEGNLKGHSFGNLFLSALEKMKGNFSKGVEEAAKILDVLGEVIPVTEKDTHLYMKLKNGKILEGENEINHDHSIETEGIKRIYLAPLARANKKAIERILKADMIVIGPGNHFCSIIPNFLVKGIPEAIRKSKAKVVYNCNLVNKKGHTEKYALTDYVGAINKYIGRNRIDYVTFNKKIPEKELIGKYESQGELLVKFDGNVVKNKNCRIILDDILSRKKVKYDKADKLAGERAFIRHDSDRLAKILVGILKHKL